MRYILAYRAGAAAVLAILSMSPGASGEQISVAGGADVTDWLSATGQDLGAESQVMNVGPLSQGESFCSGPGEGSADVLVTTHPLTEADIAKCRANVHMPPTARVELGAHAESGAPLMLYLKLPRGGHADDTLAYTRRLLSETSDAFVRRLGYEPLGPEQKGRIEKVLYSGPDPCNANCCLCLKPPPDCPCGA